jgi:autotransporter-associated beta strand protein
VSGASLTINQAANTTFAGAINGNGQIVKQGAGTLTLTGTAGNYSGTFGVNNGRVNFNGALYLGTVSANSSGTVGGTGFINVLNMNGGTIAPGTSAGTLTVDTLNAGGGTYLWELSSLSTTNPGVNYDRIVVQNQANFYESADLTISFIDSATNPNAGNPFWNVTRQWAIIDGTGGGVLIGDFGTITNPSWNSGFFSMSNNGTQLVLTWTPVPEPSFILGFIAPVLLAGFARLYRRSRLKAVVTNEA